MKKLSHINKSGEAQMVDVSDKKITKRIAVASAKVLMNAETIETIRQNTNPKGDPLEVARIAGTMAAKQTSNLIPLCHQITLAKIDVKAELRNFGVFLQAEVVTNAQTGVEMEALTAVSVAALAVYDMCKAIDKKIVITEVQLEKKRGGKSGNFQRK